MEDYSVNVPNPNGSWLYETGSGNGDRAYVRCPFCGAVFGLMDLDTAPDKCHACGANVSGNDKLKCM